MVKLGTIKEAKSKIKYFGSGGLYADNYYVKFSKEINSSTKDTEIRIGGTPVEEEPAPEIPLYYEKDKYNAALQDAAESIEEEKKMKKLEEEKERQRQQEERRQQEKEEYNNADTVDDKIAERLKNDENYQETKNWAETADNANWRKDGENEAKKRKVEITNEERQKLENEKNAAAAIQPGGKRRSRKKRNMKKSKKGKSKNRR